MALCNMDGSIVQMNPAFYRMLGYSQAELEQLTFRDFTHPEDLEKANQYRQGLDYSPFLNYMRMEPDLIELLPEESPYRSMPVDR